MTLSVERVLAARQADRDHGSCARSLFRDARELPDHAHLATLDARMNNNSLRWTLVFPVAGVHWQRVPLYDETRVPEVRIWLEGYDRLTRDWSSMFHLLKRLTAQAVEGNRRIADIRVKGEVQRDSQACCAVTVNAKAVASGGAYTESMARATFDPLRWPDTSMKSNGPMAKTIADLINIHKPLFFYMMRYPFPGLKKYSKSSSFFYYVYTIGAPDVTSFLFTAHDLTDDDLSSVSRFMKTFVQPLFGRRVAMGQWEEFITARHSVPCPFRLARWRKPEKWTVVEQAILSSSPVRIDLPAGGKFLGRLPSQLVRMAIENARGARNVLLSGATGAGKTYIARLIHEVVNPGGVFVERNAPSLEDGQVWHELRSIVKQNPRRRITLFLDEIDKTKEPLQAQLLNFLQGLKYPSGRRVAEFPAAAIIAAGSQIEDRVQKREFLPDLENRFEYQISLPKLTERRSDVLLLMHAFVNDIAEGGAARPIVFDEFVDWFVYRYSWDRGDVRELRQVARRIANLLGGQREVTMQFLEGIATDLGQFGVFVERELSRPIQ